MKIKTQFIIAMLLFGVLVMIVAASAIFTDQQVEQLYDQEEVAHAIERDASDLSYLSNDYLLYRESQQRARWQSKLASLSEHLSRLSADSPEERVLVGDIRESQRRLRAVFASVISTLERSSRPHGAVDTNLIAASSSRMAVQNQRIIFDCVRLSRMLRDQVDQLKRKNIVLIFILLAVFGAYFLADYVFVFGRTLRSIRELQAGTEVIGAGALDFTVPVKSNDEVGQLSSAFNRMAANLKRVTASKAELEAEAEERKQAEAERERIARQRQLALDAAHLGWWHYDPITRMSSWDDRYREIFGVTGYERPNDELLAQIIHPDDLPALWAKVEAALYPVDPQPYGVEYRINRPDGVMRWVEAYGIATFEGDGDDRRATSFVGTVADITERKRAESEQHLMAAALHILNRGSSDLRTSIRETLGLIKDMTGFDAVGLRMYDGDDYPYYEQNGFSDEFVENEDFLCRRDDGSVVRDAEARAVPECTCGLVLTGQTDPSLPFFTEGGSFWTNVSSDLLEIPAEDDPRTNPRNRCIHVGYQSVALVPVRSGEEIVGLLQLNGRAEGMFYPELIRFFERLADNIGLALKRKQAEEALRESEEEYRTLFSTLLEGFCIIEMVFDDDGKPIDYRFLEINPAFEQQTGLHDAQGKLMREVAPDHEAHWFEIYGKIALTGEPARFVNQAAALGRWYDVSAYRVGGQESRKVAILFSDITDRMELERQREDLYDREHRIAEMLQQAIAPRDVPGSIAGCEIATVYQPALDEAQVGGDFFDVFELDDGKIGVVIGDVVGKGVLAATKVSAARYAFRSYAYVDPRPSRVVALANDALSRGGAIDNMLTACFMVVDTDSGSLTYTNAGHEPPVVRRASREIEEFEVSGMPLGIQPGISYTEASLRIGAGDVVVMVTDGITEARSVGRGMLEKSGLHRIVAEGDSSPRELADRLLEVARGYNGGRLQDDVAIVALGLCARPALEAAIG